MDYYFIFIKQSGLRIILIQISADCSYSLLARGWILGAGTALLGKVGAIACTVADKSSITEHYNAQLRALATDTEVDHSELIATISQFRDEEQEHHDIGLENDAKMAPVGGYQGGMRSRHMAVGEI